MHLRQLTLTALTAGIAVAATSKSASQYNDKTNNQPQISSNVLKLRKTGSQSLSSKRLHNHWKHHGPANKTYATHIADVDGKDFVASIEVGGQGFDVLIDTGSSELWLATQDFVCTDANYTVEDQSYCTMGKNLYKGDFPGKQIPDSNFQVFYGTDWYCNGRAGIADVSIAGLQVKNQTMGLIDQMWYTGDNRASGLLGLEGAATGVYKGTDPSKNNDNSTIDHMTFFSNMWRSGLVDPVFSMAQQRGSEEGWLAFGGIPPAVNVSSEFYTAPLIKSDSSDDDDGVYSVSFYNVIVDSLIYSPAGGNATGSSSIPLNSSMVIDSGTQLLYLQEDIGIPILESYDPPAQYLPGLGNFAVPCNATPPALAVQLGGHAFPIDKHDMIKQDKIDPDTGYCATGVGLISLPFSILGDTFLNNVVAVFDVVAAEMRFAEHRY